MKRLWFIVLIFIFLTGCNPSIDSVKQESNDNDQEEVDYNIEIIESEHTNMELYVLGKVWGYLKYYHPNVATGQFNWDAELFKILPQILESKSQDDRDSILSEWITKLGTFEEKPVVEKDVVITPDLDWISDLNLSEELQEMLIHIKSAKRPETQHYVSLAEQVGNPVFEEETYDSMSFDNDGLRLLSLYRYWNMIEYFYPFKHLIEDDWDMVLKEFIPKFTAASDELAYKLTTLELISRIHDTQAIYSMEDDTINQFWGMKAAPLKITFVENKAVVTGYYEYGDQSGILKGDVITKINHQTVEEILDEKLKYIPASNSPAKLREMALKLLRTNEEKLTLEYIRDGKTLQTSLDVYPLTVLDVNNQHLKSIKEGFQNLDSNIAYLNTGNLFNSEITEIMPKITGTKGLIIDLRGIPSDYILFHLAEFLLPKSTEFTRISTGSLENPGLFKKVVDLQVGKTNKDYYKGKVIILLNEQTQYLAEFTAMAFKKAPNATVIGSTTAGSVGNPSFLILPGGIHTVFTGINIYNPDGSETQRVGIIPDITVTPSVEGIKNNKDEVLEKAISLINDGSRE